MNKIQFGDIDLQSKFEYSNESFVQMLAMCVTQTIKNNKTVKSLELPNESMAILQANKE